MSSQDEDNKFLDEYEDEEVSFNQPIQKQLSEAVISMSQESKVINSTETINESIQQQIQQAKQQTAIADAKQPLVWKISDMTSNGPLQGFNIYNALMQNNTYQYTLYGEAIINRWKENFQYILGPTNPAFIDATLSHKDIAWGYRLEYNPNGILWRVSAAGIPHPDDYDNFLEQNRVIEETHNRTMEDVKHIDTSQVAKDSMLTDTVGIGVKNIPATQDSNKSSRAINVNTKPVSYAIKLTDSSDNTFLVAPEDNFTGPVVFKVKGIEYKLRVPFFDMGSNSDINSGGWTIIEDPYDYSIQGSDAFSFSELIGKITAPDPKTNARVINLLSLIVGVGDSVATSYHPAPIQVLVQQKDDECSLIIQAGVGSDLIQSYADKTVEGPVGNKYFRVTLDARHADDQFTHYVSVDENGNFVFTRKLYSGDKVEEYVNGDWKDSTAEYLMKSVPASDSVLFKRIDEKLRTVIEPLQKIYAL